MTRQTVRSTIAALLFSAAAVATILKTASFEAGAATTSDVCPGTRVDVATFGFTPYIRLEVAGREGWFAIDTAASYSIIDSHAAYGLMQGQSYQLTIKGFPYVDDESFRASDLTGYTALWGERILGILGQNILSLVSVQFEYDADSAHIVVSSVPCSPRLVGNPDFAEVDQTGYYSRNRLHLLPGEPNLPRLYVKIGAVRAPVYLDSGNPDGSITGIRGAIAMNDQFVNSLLEQNVQMDREDTVRSVPCSGPQAQLQAQWWIRNKPLEITNADGEVLFTYGGPVVESVSPNCSYISSSRTPLGVIGASFFQRWGTVIIDPIDERVWVRKNMPGNVPELPRSDLAWRPENGTGRYLDGWGNLYEGDFKNGRFEGHGFWRGQNGDRYQGGFLNGHWEGYGVLLGQNGTRYEGYFHNGQPAGSGVLNLASSDHFEGEFRGSFAEGQGFIRWANGNRYWGPWSNWVPNGYGTFIRYPDGYRVDGLFRNGVYVGR